MNWSRILAVIWKDWREAMRGTWMLAPTAFLVAYFGVVLPSLLILIAKATGEVFIPVNLPIPLKVPSIGGELSRSIYFAFTAVIPPLFLVIPLAISTMLAADGFAGERERGTMELLLAAPLSERELLMGKVLSALLPGIASSWLTFMLMVPIVNVMSHDIFEGIWFPPGVEWYLIVLLISPLYSFLAISLTCALSSRVKSVKEAQQGAGILIVPLLVAVVAQTFWGMVLDAGSLIALAAVLIAIDSVLIWLLPRMFSGIKYLVQ